MTDEHSSEFMMESYKDASQNVMHIEGQMFNHMSFFFTLFIGLLTAAIAILKLTNDPNQAIGMTQIVGLLCVPFLFLWFIGEFEIEMVLQLRIRKIKFVEVLTRVREYFIKADPDISNYMVLPKRLEEAPPYLRIGSDDWYKLVFLNCLNTISLSLFLLGPLMVWLLKGFVSYWLLILILTLIFSVAVYFRPRYRRVMNRCLVYDKKREDRMGKVSEYNLLEIPIPRSWRNRTIADWFRSFEKK